MFVFLRAKYCFIVFSLFLPATAGLLGQNRIPEDYLGAWEGTLEIYNGPGKVQEIKMLLELGPQLAQDSFGYTLTYMPGSPAEDRRAYALVCRDRERGLYHIDERNGILLEARLFGAKMISSFAVQGTRIDFLYTFGPGEIAVEVISSATDAAEMTGGDEDVPEVANYRPLVYQKASLQKRP